MNALLRKPLKVAIYTIAKNEEQFCERWAKSGADADGLFVLDTGSSDKTAEKLRDLGVTVGEAKFDSWKTLHEYYALHRSGARPWRFDIARNMNLDMIPNDFDVCLQIDMDEVLIPEWRKVVEKYWKNDTNHMWYLYAWSMNGDVPVRQFQYQKCHARHGFIWKRPVHEVICPKDGVKESIQYSNTLLVKHYPDGSKSRSSYLNLLILACQEDPADAPLSFYLAREYSFVSRWSEVITEGLRYLTIRGADGMEKSAVCLLMAKAYGFLKDIKKQEKYLMYAAAECPDQREGWTELAEFYRIQQQYLGGTFAARRALSVKHHPMSYLNSTEAWREKPHDTAAVCSFYAGMKSDAVDHAWDAIKENPFDNRLISNSYLIKQALFKEKPSAGEEIDEAPTVDVVILSWSKDKDYFEMMRQCVKNLRASTGDVKISISVVETNSNLSSESFYSADFDAWLITPDEPFGYNRYLQIAYDESISSESKYIMILNNDVVDFSRDFISDMVSEIKKLGVQSLSPMGIRESKHPGFHIDPSVPYVPGYDVNGILNGWCLMFDKEILKEVEFRDLFPAELKFYKQDMFYAEVLKNHEFKHAMTTKAQALHLQAQSHSLIDDELKKSMIQPDEVYNRLIVELHHLD